MYTQWLMVSNVKYFAFLIILIWLPKWYAFDVHYLWDLHKERQNAWHCFQWLLMNFDISSIEEMKGKRKREAGDVCTTIFAFFENSDIFCLSMHNDQIMCIVLLRLRLLLLLHLAPFPPSNVWLPFIFGILISNTHDCVTVCVCDIVTLYQLSSSIDEREKILSSTLSVQCNVKVMLINWLAGLLLFVAVPLLLLFFSFIIIIFLCCIPISMCRCVCSFLCVRLRRVNSHWFRHSCGSGRITYTLHLFNSVFFFFFFRSLL